MKKIVLLTDFWLLFFTASYGQLNEWTWVNGDNAGTSSVIGTQGIFDPLNHPMPQYESNGWTDNQGNFWYLTTLDSLWEYNPVIQQWAFIWGGVNPFPVWGIKGVPSTTNEPGYRSFGFPTWTDAGGDLWLFGGYAGGTTYADLWRYNIASNMWTWCGGSNIANDPGVYGTMGVPSVNNYPMGRCETNGCWVDSATNSFWLFGGDRATTYTGINDLWKYNVTTGEWTWMKGDTLASNAGTYGVMNLPDPMNDPGGRLQYSKWNDLSGCLYFFAGSQNVTSYKNDVWKYDPSINEWTWKNGSSGTSQGGFATASCAFDQSNTPASDFENKVCWTDKCGHGWVFCTAFNSVWTYDTDLGQWSIMKGNYNSSVATNYGTLGVSDPINNPGIVTGAVSWRSKTGEMYFLENLSPVMWRYVPDPLCSGCTGVPVALFSAPHHICPGTCTDFTNLSVNATSYHWTFTSASPSVSTDANPVSICYNVPGTYDVQLIASSTTGSDTLLLHNYITVFPYPPPQGIAQNGDTLFANTGAVSYQWYHGGNIIAGATNFFYIASESGDFNVVATDANGCEVEAAIFDVVASVQSAVNSQELATIYPNPVLDKLEITNPFFKDKKEIDISIYNMLGENIFSAADCGLRTVDCRLLPFGTYYLEVRSDEKVLRTKFVKQ